MPRPGFAFPGRGRIRNKPSSEFQQLIMPSTDIDGSVTVILSTAEARRVYEHLREAAGGRGLDTIEHKLAAKIARDLGLPPLE